MNLKWPWKEFPENQESWNECKRQMEEAIRKLQSCMFLGTFKDVTGLKEGIREFFIKVLESVEVKDTITIDEFKKLVPADSPDRVEPYGKFGISLKSQKKQCENLKVGDTVFFLNATYKGLDDNNVPQVDIIITQAKVVE